MRLSHTFNRDVQRGGEGVALVFGIGVGDVPEGAAPIPVNELELLVEIATTR